jgi:hypothetical protein
MDVISPSGRGPGRVGFANPNQSEQKLDAHIRVKRTKPPASKTYELCLRTNNKRVHQPAAKLASHQQTVVLYKKSQNSSTLQYGSAPGRDRVWVRCETLPLTKQALHVHIRIKHTTCASVLAIRIKRANCATTDMCTIVQTCLPTYKINFHNLLLFDNMAPYWY